MWAMMPIFLNLLKSCLAILQSLPISNCRLPILKIDTAPIGNWKSAILLPLVMRKRLVRVRHAVRVFLLLHRVTAVVCGIENFGRQPIRHRLFTGAMGGGDE